MARGDRESPAPVIPIGTAVRARLAKTFGFTFTWSQTRSKEELTVDWLCEGLRLAKGPPCLVAGESTAGKSWLLHDLAIAVATGGETLGHACRQGTVVFIDYDCAGQLVLERRHHQLCAARGITPDTLNESFAFVHSQDISFYIDDPKFESIAKDAFKGVALCVVDAFAGSVESTNEMDRQQVRKVFDKLARVSLATDCVFVIADHFVKPMGERNSRDVIHNIAGSKGKLQGAQNVFLVLQTKSGPVELIQRKERLGKCIAPIYFVVDADEKAASLQAVDAPLPSSKSNGATIASTKLKIEAFIAKHPEIDASKKNELFRAMQADGAGVGRNMFFAALKS